MFLNYVGVDETSSGWMGFKWWWYIERLYQYCVKYKTLNQSIYSFFFLLNEQFKRFLYNVVACFTFMSYISLSKIYVYDIILCYWRYTRRTLLRLICTLTHIVVDIKRTIQTYVHYENEKNKIGYMFRPLLGITDLICLLK